MPDGPAAEIVVDAPLIRRLLRAQAPHLSDAGALPLEFAAEGWDCTVWRLGTDLAVRLPRRGIAAPLIESEQRYLPALAQRLRGTGVAVPAPVLAGRPTPAFPWPWSVVPWFDGDAGLAVPRGERTPWASPLAAALVALHEPADGRFPPNPFRGVPLAARAPAVADRLSSRRERATEPVEGIERLAGLWQRGLAAPAWSGPPRWIHGDLHPGNLIARSDRLVAVIDFGDLTAGDPAYDLAVAWLAFDAHGRARFRSALEGRYDDAAWRRAHAWAAAVTVMLLEQSDDSPTYAALARECLAELSP